MRHSNPHLYRMSSLFGSHEQGQIDLWAHTLSPLRDRNVAWRASLWACWTGGKGLVGLETGLQQTEIAPETKNVIMMVSESYCQQTSSWEKMKMYICYVKYTLTYFPYGDVEALWDFPYGDVEAVTNEDKELSQPHRLFSWKGLRASEFGPLCMSVGLYGLIWPSSLLYWVLLRWTKGRDFC